MKNQAMPPTVQQNYELLKISRIRNFNHHRFPVINKSFYFILIIIAIILQVYSTMGQTTPSAPSISLATYCTGFTSPTVIANCGDARLFIGEKNGYIYIIDANGNKLPTPFLNIDAQVGSSGNEQGLLGISFHPKYASNGYFFVYYTDNNGNTQVNRYTRNSSNPNLADAGSVHPILSLIQPAPNHNGGCIQFGPDGYLYIGLGDGGNQGDPNANGQNTQTLLGKMLRIDIDNGSTYSIPPSNPYATSSTVLHEIWAIGLRNPWKWSFDRLTGDMWIGDVGEGTWEEVDYQPAGVGGRNYGWRCYEGNHGYNTNGCNAQSTYTSPVSEYQHSSTNGCSITGGYVYRGGKYASLFGHYLVTDYCSGVIRDITSNGNGGWNTVTLGTFAPYQYSAFGEDKHGELYLAELGSGKIMKIKDNNCQPTAFIKGNGTQTICSGKTLKLESIYGSGNTYQWKKNNVNISGATNANYNITTAGSYKVIVTNPNGCTNISNTINVTVLTSPVATVNANGPTTFCQGSSVVLQANTGTGLSYQWKKYGSNITGATNSSYTANKTGNYKVFLTASNGCTSSSGAIVVNVNCKTAGDNSAATILNCVPNPTTGLLSVLFETATDQTINMEVTDLMGQVVLQKNILVSNGLNTLPIDLSSSPKGIYFISIITKDQKQTSKFLLQ